MFPLISGLMSGASSLIGSIFSSDTSAKNTQAQIEAQQGFLNQQEAYNTQMSNTAYQRARTDMTAAGLNPMMMFGSGGPASSPSVGAPSVPVPQTQSSMAGLGPAVQRGLDAAVSAKTFDKMTDEIANLQTQRQLIGAETGATEARTGLTKEQELLTTNEAQRVALGMPAARVSARQAESLLGLPQSVVDWMTRGEYVGGKSAAMMQPFTDIISSARGVRDLLPRKSAWESTNQYGETSFGSRWDQLYR